MLHSLSRWILFSFCLLAIPIKAQDTFQVTSAPVIGLEYDFIYSDDFIHHAVGFNVGLNRHQVGAGAQFTYVFLGREHTGTPYQPHTWGLYGNWRYSLIHHEHKLVPFAQLRFAFYQVSYETYQLGTGLTTERKDFIVENTASLGLRYNPLHHLVFRAGAGFGSTDGFFLILTSFLPQAYVGVEYRF